jgi:hypothetical protein
MAGIPLEDHLSALLKAGYGVSIEQPEAGRYEVILINSTGDRSGSAATLSEAFRAAFHAPMTPPEPPGWPRCLRRFAGQTDPC